MKQLLIRFSILTGLALLGLGIGAAIGQTTTVSGNVTDTSGQVWAGGTISYVFSPNPAYPASIYYWGSGPLSISYYTPTQVNLDSSGNFSLTVPDNLTITPAGSQWGFVVCPNASVSNCITFNTVITGATQNISSLIYANSFPISVAASSVPKAYSDSEIKVAPNQGGIYYNTISNVPKYYNGSIWQILGGGGTPPATTGGIQYNNSGVLTGSAATIDAAGNITTPTGTTTTLDTVATKNLNSLITNNLYNAQAYGSLAAALAAFPSTGGDVVTSHDSGIENAQEVNNIMFYNTLPTSSCLYDNKLGAFGVQCFNPGWSKSRNAFPAMPVSFLFSDLPLANVPVGINAGMQSVTGFDEYMETSVPGFNIGTNNGIGTGSWFVDYAMNINHISHHAGIANDIKINSNKFGPGDLNGFRWNGTSKGGITDGSGEGVTPIYADYVEASNWVATVNANYALGSLQIVGNCAGTGCIDIGVGQTLLDESNGVLSGNWTYVSSSSLGYATMSTSFALPASTSTGTLQSNCILPGNPEQIYIMVCNMSLTTKPLDNHPITIFGQETETSVVTSSTLITPASGDTLAVWAVTLPLIYSHSAGDMACVDGAAGRYFEQTKYSTSSNKYVMKGICSPTTNTALVTWQLYGNPTSQFAGTGTVKAYWGAETLDIRKNTYKGTIYDYTNLYPLGVTPLPAAFNSGDILEQVNNTALAISMNKIDISTYNPYISDISAIQINTNGTGAGGLPSTGQNSKGLVQFNNGAPSSSYAFSGTGFNYNIPMISAQGNWGPVIAITNAPEKAQSYCGGVNTTPALICVQNGENSEDLYFVTQFSNNFGVAGFSWQDSTYTLGLTGNTTMLLEHLDPVTANGVIGDRVPYALIKSKLFQETLTTPASVSAPCAPGQFTYDTNYGYVCTAINTWKSFLLLPFQTNPNIPVGASYSANTNLVATAYNEHFECTGAYTLNLPLSPLAYMTINIVNTSSTANCTIGSSSANIGNNTLSTSITITPGAAVQFNYNSASGNWRSE